MLHPSTLDVLFLYGQLWDQNNCRFITVFTFNLLTLGCEILTNLVVFLFCVTVNFHNAFHD